MYKKILLSISILSISACSSGISTDDRLATLGELQRQQMERLAALEDNFRNLSGRVEELQFSVDKKFSKEISGLKESLDTVENRLPPPEIVPNEVLLADLAYARESESDASSSFYQALENVKIGKFSEALKILNTIVLEQGNSLEYRVFFWQGLACEGLYEYREALVYYNKLVEYYAKNERAALTLYRLTKVFQKIGDNNMADLTYKKLSISFPNSNYTKKAKQEL